MREREETGGGGDKAMLAKLKEFYSFVLGENADIVQRFQAEYQAQMTAGEAPEIVQVIIDDFDTSLLE